MKVKQQVGATISGNCVALSLASQAAENIASFVRVGRRMEIQIIIVNRVF